MRRRKNRRSFGIRFHEVPQYDKEKYGVSDVKPAVFMHYMMVGRLGAGTVKDGIRNRRKDLQ